MTLPWISRRRHDAIVAALRDELNSLSRQVLTLEAKLGRHQLAHTREHPTPAKPKPRR